MGRWKSNNVIITDDYADAIEKHIDDIRNTLEKKFPKITGEQMVETVSFVAGRLRLEK